jgi:CRP-like cAMP-binding protein
MKARKSSVAAIEAEQQVQQVVLKENFNVTLPRMLQRRNAVSAESTRPGELDDAQFVIQSFPKSQVQRARIQDIVSGIVLFQGLSDSIMKDLVGGFFEMKFNDGDTIIVQGDVIADRFFLLESGQCDIFIKKGSADPIKVHTVTPGGFFGELALLYNAPRAATVKSVGESKLWALDRGTFKNCMARASKQQETEGNSGVIKLLPKATQSATPTQQRGAFALIDEQVMKVRFLLLIVCLFSIQQFCVRWLNNNSCLNILSGSRSKRQRFS